MSGERGELTDAEIADELRRIESLMVTGRQVMALVTLCNRVGADRVNAVMDSVWGVAS